MIEPPRLRCIVVVRDGPSRRVGPSGLLIGRQGDCDIVALDPSISRRHALVKLTATGAELVPLGKSPVAVASGGATAQVVQPHALADGDVLALPGLELTVKIDLPPPDAAAPAGFVLQRKGGSFGIAHSPFTLGGGDADDLIVKAWPPGTLHLHVAQGELFVEVRDGGAARNGEELAADTLEPLAIGDHLTCRGETFTIAHADAAATTAVRGATELPTHVAIELLPRGGRVVFTVGGRALPVYLPDRRFDLVMALLRPPAGHAAGEFISDDAVRAVVWPRKPSVSRPEINMLISRCRRDLVEAGLAGPRLIERAPGGGGTRVALAPGAVVEVSS
ncbi:MAG: FHA domain-containing protein [Deltaproteobacteria bacterium]|nr:FHA domain-containing protein [Deltaproteobacteria bacterium]MCW5806282.1 FHA domain-containing protein [Deltaproteobacteria bacterium]